MTGLVCGTDCPTSLVSLTSDSNGELTSDCTQQLKLRLCTCVRAASRVSAFLSAGLGLRSTQVVRCASRRAAGRVRSGPPGRVRWRAGGACTKIFLGGRARAGARGENIFLSFQSCVLADGRRTEEDAVFVCSTGGKAQFRLHSASPS